MPSEEDRPGFPGNLPLYSAVNQAVLRSVPATAARILDLGCGDGALGLAIKRERSCQIVGVTHSMLEATKARATLDQIEVADLNAFDPERLGVFDCIVCSHVLEHLESPGRLLRALLPCVANGGVLIIALPNVLFWRQRFSFLIGRFRYTDGGLMDRTHLRFFDWETAAELVTSAGFIIDQRAASGGGLPLSRFLGKRPSRALDRWAQAALPGLFSTQFILRCKPKEDLP